MTQTYKLDDVKPEVFQLLVQWLYGQKLQPFLTQAEDDLYRLHHRSFDLKRGKEWSTVNLKMKNRAKSLVSLWVLGDRLCIPGVQNVVIDELEELRTRWDLDMFWCAPDVYLQCLPKTTLRRYILDQCVHCLSVYKYDIFSEYFTKEMLLDIVKETLVTKPPNPFEKGREYFCQLYHIPEDNEEDTSEKKDSP